MTSKEILAKLNLKDEEHFRKKYLKAAIDLGYVKMTIPSKPTSKNQKYGLTEKGTGKIK